MSPLGIVEIRDKCPASIEGLRFESAEIERKFAKLAASIFQSLRTRNISKEDLVACLMGFSCLTKVFDGSDQSMFRKQRRRFEDPSTTVATVWSVVGDYCSFFDYDILEVIADTLGNDHDKLCVAEYEKDFEDYARRRLFIDQVSKDIPDKENSATENIPIENTQMFVVLDPTYDGCEIGHLKRLQLKLSSILKLKKGVLRLCKVKKGSIKLVFKIPSLIVNIVFPLTPDQESALRELGVIQLDCGDYHFRAKV